MAQLRVGAGLAALGLIAMAGLVNAHGDVTPQPVKTDALPEVGEEWLTENPYRAETAGEEVWRTAVEIGASGFNQNCARCHGLGAVSGGLAPDLRYLEATEYGDEWFAERFQFGYTQTGTTKKPSFGEVLGQKPPGRSAPISRRAPRTARLTPKPTGRGRSAMNWPRAAWPTPRR